MVKKAKGKHRLDKFYHLAKEQGYVYIQERWTFWCSRARTHARLLNKFDLSVVSVRVLSGTGLVQLSSSFSSTGSTISLRAARLSSTCVQLQVSVHIHTLPFPNCLLLPCICMWQQQIRLLYITAYRCSMACFGLLCFVVVCSNDVMLCCRRMASSCCEAHADEQPHHRY